MQYILTEAEYTKLKDKQKHDIGLSVAKLQKLCTKIANEMPIIFWNRKEPRPWGCKISDDHGDEWYCDECPVQDICPHDDKNWSQ